VGRSLLRGLAAGLDEGRDLVEDVEDELFVERGKTVLLGAQMERREKS
jgi:hypothetical protein